MGNNGLIELVHRAMLMLPCRETSVFEQYISSAIDQDEDGDGRPLGGAGYGDGDDVFADRSESPSSSESEFFSLEEDQVSWSLHTKTQSNIQG